MATKEKMVTKEKTLEKTYPVKEINIDSPVGISDEELDGESYNEKLAVDPVVGPDSESELNNQELDGEVVAQVVENEKSKNSSQLDTLEGGDNHIHLQAIGNEGVNSFRPSEIPLPDPSLANIKCKPIGPCLYENYYDIDPVKIDKAILNPAFIKKELEFVHKYPYQTPFQMMGGFGQDPIQALPIANAERFIIDCRLGNLLIAHNTPCNPRIYEEAIRIYFTNSKENELVKKIMEERKRAQYGPTYTESVDGALSPDDFSKQFFDLKRPQYMSKDTELQEKERKKLFSEPAYFELFATKLPTFISRYIFQQTINTDFIDEQSRIYERAKNQFEKISNKDLLADKSVTEYKSDYMIEKYARVRETFCNLDPVFIKTSIYDSDNEVDAAFSELAIEIFNISNDETFELITNKKEDRARYKDRLMPMYGPMKSRKEEFEDKLKKFALDHFFVYNNASKEKVEILDRCLEIYDEDFKDAGFDKDFKDARFDDIDRHLIQNAIILKAVSGKNVKYENYFYCADNIKDQMGKFNNENPDSGNMRNNLLAALEFIITNDKFNGITIPESTRKRAIEEKDKFTEFKEPIDAFMDKFRTTYEKLKRNTQPLTDFMEALNEARLIFKRLE